MYWCTTYLYIGDFGELKKLIPVNAEFNMFYSNKNSRSFDNHF